MERNGNWFSRFWINLPFIVHFAFELFIYYLLEISPSRIKW